jgi:hypothetical protein
LRTADREELGRFNLLASVGTSRPRLCKNTRAHFEFSDDGARHGIRDPDSGLVADVNPASAWLVRMPIAMLFKGVRTFDTVEYRGYVLVQQAETVGEQAARGQNRT